jgi:hypothetical protein
MNLSFFNFFPLSKAPRKTGFKIINLVWFKNLSLTQYLKPFTKTIFGRQTVLMESRRAGRGLADDYINPDLNLI